MLSWLQTLSSKRTRSESEDSLADTPPSQNDIAAGQTQANESSTCAAVDEVLTSGDEDESGTTSTDDNSRVSEHEWPECWSHIFFNTLLQILFIFSSSF